MMTKLDKILATLCIVWVLAFLIFVFVTEIREHYIRRLCEELGFDDGGALDVLKQSPYCCKRIPLENIIISVEIDKENEL
jgi:hypothetical protein